MDSNPHSDGDPRWRWSLIAAGALLCGAYLLAERLRVGAFGLPLDDGWIHLALARNLADGAGLSLNPGELVAASTAPLWTALLALLFLLPGPILVWIKLAGVGLHLAAVDATYRLSRELGLGRGAAALAAVLTLSSGWLVWSALSGLEIPLFVWLSLWGVIFHLRERRAGGAPAASLAVLAAACLARPEGLLLVLLAVADRLLVPVAGRGAALRALPAALLPVAALLVPLALFHLAIGDSVLPTTFAAKASGARNGLPDLRYLYTVAGLFFSANPFLVLFAAAGALRLAQEPPGRGGSGLVAALWPFALPLAYAAISPRGVLLLGNFGRYFFPLIPFLALLTAAAVEPLGRSWRRQARAPRRALTALAVTLLVLPGLVSWLETAGRYVQNVANVEAGDVLAARWLGARLPAEAVLAVNDIGALGYLLPNRLIDLAGIGNPELRRRYFAAAGRREGLLRFLSDHRPDYLVVFPSWFPELLAGGEYRRVAVFEIRDNITLGGDELAVYATPWTRYELAEP